jgi:Asp-tRNA(Asn)/Glu-tRNA(Gln) amidotransferase A subunit family amidase
MDAHGLDAWISPSAPTLPPRGLDTTGDPIMNLPWTHSGLPAMSIPSGKTAEGLQFGLQIVGRWFEDERLIQTAHDLAEFLDSVDSSASLL